MTLNVLVTGAAGYIGGALVADLLVGKVIQVQKEHITATVRSQEQAKALSKLGVNVIQLDLTDETAVAECLRKQKINVVVHTASAFDPGSALPLITALSKQKEVIGEETYFIHTSALSAFYEATGWPAGPTKDTGPVFDTEKQLRESSPIRNTDVAIIEHSEAKGVSSFIIIPSIVYGKGSGEWNKLSIVIPPYVETSIAQKTVFKFADNTKLSGVHISDLTALYGRIIEKVSKKEAIPSGREGYYFAVAHHFDWYEALDGLAGALKARGLVNELTTKVWPSDAFAAESLGIPIPFLQPLWNSGDNFVVERTQKIGWKPVWNKDRFLQNIDDEVQNVVELGKAKSSIVNTLFEVAKG